MGGLLLRNGQQYPDDEAHWHRVILCDATGAPPNPTVSSTKHRSDPSSHRTVILSIACTAGALQGKLVGASGSKSLPTLALYLDTRLHEVFFRYPIVCIH